MSVPASLQYPKVLPTAVAAVSRQFSNCPVSGTSFGGGQTTSIDIAQGGRSWLDPAGSILRFRVTVAYGATGESFALLAHNAIQSLSLSSSAGAAQIEHISDYSLVYDVLRTMTTSMDKALSIDTLTMGQATGLIRDAKFTAVSANSSGYIDFAIPILSIIGTASAGSLYLPLFALDANLRLDITWAESTKALATLADVSAASYTISNVFLDTTHVELADSAQRQIESLTNGVYQWSSSVWKVFRTVHTAGALSNSVMVPSRVDSAKSLYLVQRQSADEFSYDRSSVQARVRNYLANYRVRIGNQFVTQSPVDCTGSGLPALIEAVRVMCNPTSEACGCLITSANWAVDADADATATRNTPAFVVGCELESFSNNPGKLICGQTTAANSLIVDLVYSSGTTPAAANIDCILESDATFSVAGGALQVAF